MMPETVIELARQAHTLGVWPSVLYGALRSLEDRKPGSAKGATDFGERRQWDVTPRM